MTQIKEPQQTEKIWNTAFVTIFIANAMMNLGQQMVQTLISKYAYSLGVAAAAIGLVASGYAYTALILKMVSAPAIDAFPKKFVLACAMGVMGIAFLGYSFTTSVPLLFALRLVQGSGQAFTATCCLAMATDALPIKKIGKGIGYFSLAQAICQAIGPTLGAQLAGNFGYGVTFTVAALCMFLAAGMAVCVKTPVQERKTKKFRISLNSIIAKEAILPAVLMFFLVMAYCNINSFMLIYGEAERGIASTQLSYFFTVYAVTLLLSRPIVGGLSDKYGYVKVLVPSMVLFAVSFLLISTADSLWKFLLASFINAFGYGACQPTIQSLAMKRVSKEKRGAASCTSFIGLDLGNMVGPIIAGAVVGQMGYAGMYRIMTIAIFAAIVILLVFRKKVDTEN